MISRLTELLATPVAHLPPGAWADRQLRAFVPSRYAVCYSRWEPVTGRHALEPSRIIRLLPAEARRLLRGKDRSYPAYSSPLALDVSPSQRSVTCSELTTSDARRLAGIFGHAGYEADPFQAGSPAKPYLNERFRAKLPLDVVFSFEPILPHGQWQAMGG